ncbi:MAG TPA: sulfotransferase [Herpetosiphonaceae bacterium]|nr:sulfotransferase [Herpetosiphonaceae bacterium]
MYGRSIIIVGVPRSGTSMTAKLVKEWGAQAGADQHFASPDAFNQTGYWEYLPLKNFHDTLLRACGASMISPPSEAQLRELAHDPHWREQAFALLREMGENIWFWKQPLLSFLLPFWQEVWGNPVFIICIRNPISGALSQKRMFEARILRRDTPVDNFPLSGALLLWQHSMLSILKNTHGSTRKIFVSYERTIADYAAACSAIHASLHRMLGINGNLAAMLTVLDPKLQHHSDTDAAFFDSDHASHEQKELYRFLLKKTTNAEEPFIPEKYPMPSNWKEILTDLQSWHASFLKK